MRICIITSVPLPPQEGIGYYVDNLAKQLLKKSHQVEIITRGSWGSTPDIFSDCIRIRRAKFAPVYPFHLHLHGLFLSKLIESLQNRFDLIHIHTPLSPPVRTKLPIITTIHSSRKAAARANPYNDPQSIASRLMLPISYRVEKKLLHLSKVVTTTSHTVAEQLREYGLEPVQVKVLGNGVDHHQFQPSQAEPVGPPFVLFVGRLHLQKGLLDLFECAKIVCRSDPHVSFLLVGKGPLESKLRKMALEAGIEDRFKLLGYLNGNNRQDIVNIYQSSTIVVQPSYYEGLPTTILEAMACGKPVVATAISGALDVICPGQNGLLVPPGQPKAMAEAILSVLNQKNTQQELGLAGRRTIVNRYSWDIISNQFLDCYQSVL